MINDEQSQIVAKMQENGLELVKSDPTFLEFKQNTDDERINVHIFCDLPSPAKVTYEKVGVGIDSHTNIISDIEQLKEFAETGVVEAIDIMRARITD